MIDREQFEALQEVEKTLRSPKESGNSFALPLFMQYDMDQRTKDFDPATSKVGLIVAVEAEDVVLDGVLSKNGNTLALYIPYADVPSEVLDNPKVINFEVCESGIIELLQKSDSDEIELKLPWSGPVSDEWDSAAYNDFWAPVEQNFNRKIKTLERVGKRVRTL